MSRKLGNGIKAFYGVLFIFTSFVNLYLAVSNPGMVKGLGESACFPWLRLIVNSAPLWLQVFSLLLFAVAQTAFCVLLLHKGYWAKAGAIGGIAFLLSTILFAPYLWINSLIALPLVYLVFWLEVMDLDWSAWDALARKTGVRLFQ